MRHRGTWIVCACVVLAGSLVVASEPGTPETTSETLKPGNPWAGLPMVEGSPGGDLPETTKFIFITGSNFQPRGGASYAYGGVGCVYLANSGTDFFTIDLQLPDGVEIDFLRLYYYDASASANLRAYLTEYDGQGGYTDIFSTDSVGSGGYGSAGDFLSHTVDNTTHSLSILVRPYLASSQVQLCGVRVRYQQ
jgi:hypothetical protein